MAPSIIHKDFSELLHSISITQTQWDEIKPLALEIYNNIHKQLIKDNHQKELEIQKLDKQINKATNQILQLSSESVIKACEQQIDELIKEKNLLESELTNSTNQEIMPFEEAFDYFIKYTSDLQNIWDNGNLQDKRALLSIIFPNKLVYSKNGKFKTPEIYPIFRITNLSDIANITGIPCFFDSTVPDLKKYCDFSELKKTKSGTDDFPQIFNKNTPECGGGSYLVP